ncbi:MAG: SDR family NAD(P)-dependent oxidoreductase [Deltaproteobacteria bacterium]|nr:SDR family NAD(P)-dependent oxidoreductase [Deltaproteobacteria bacterium]
MAALAAYAINRPDRLGCEAAANYDSVATMSGGRHIVETALDKFGNVDILICNAGIVKDRTFMKMTEQEWDDVISVHLKGTFCVTQPAVKVMKAKGYGRIVFTASSSGMYGNFGQSNYGAAKMGVIGIMNTLKRFPIFCHRHAGQRVIGIMNTLKLETSRYDIKVNTVAPNADTGMTKGVFPDEVSKRIKPEFNAPVVTYLCSEENRESGFIFTMSAGWFARSAMVSGNGACIGNAARPICAEEVRDRFDQIKSLENAKPYDHCGLIYALGRPLTGR